MTPGAGERLLPIARAFLVLGGDSGMRWRQLVMRETLCVCVRACAHISRAAFLPLFSLCLPPPSPIHIVCRENQLGAEGGTAMAQALCNLPQLQTLDLG